MSAEEDVAVRARKAPENGQRAPACAPAVTSGLCAANADNTSPFSFVGTLNSSSVAASSLATASNSSEFIPNGQ